MSKVCVIGLGVVGDPTAIHINSIHDVCGYDIEPKKTKNKTYYATTNWALIKDVNIFIICVNTGWNKKPDMSAIEKVMQRVKTKSTNETLVIIESTISVGTSRKLFENLFNGQILLACCPHRFYSKDIKNHGVVQKRILGAVNKKSLEKSMFFYKSLKIPIHTTSRIEIAEMSKLAENAYRFVQIAFVEELKYISNENNLDFEEIREACNTKWNINLLEAIDGIEGDCLPKDIRILNHMALSTPLLQGAIKTDIQYKQRIKKLIGLKTI